MKFLLVILLLLLTPLTASAQVIEFSGNLRALITDISAKIRDVAYPDSDAFVIPTTAQMNTWRLAVSAALAGDLDTASQRLSTLTSAYKVIRFTEATNGRLYYLLLEADVTDRITPILVKGWGTYIFDPNPARPLLSIQVPHPIKDADTDKEGIEVFLQLGARSFLMAGTNRCANTGFSTCSGMTAVCSPDGMTLTRYRTSDVPHRLSNMFHQTHVEIAPPQSSTVVVQLHGNRQEQFCPDVLISNTNSDDSVAPDGNVNGLFNLLSAAGTNVLTCEGGPPVGCNLCGKDNVQGRFTNGSPGPCNTPFSSPNERFIHIEQSLTFRSNYGPLIDALSQIF